MTVIDLGESREYQPGEPPFLRNYRNLSRAQRRRAYAAAVLIVVAGALGGTGPAAAADPELHQVGRVRGPLTQVLGDMVITYSDDSGEIVAYPLDGAGPRWQLPSDQPPGDIATAGDLFVVSFVGLSFLESTINKQRDLPPRIVGVEAATGKPRWQVDGWPVGPLSGPVVAVGTGTVRWESIMGVDVHDGKHLWDVPLTGAPLARTEIDGVRRRADSILVIDRTGVVHTMSLADGTTRSAGHIAAGSEGLFEWRGLLGVRVPAAQPTADAHDEFLLYRLGQDQPLWRRDMPPNSPVLSPCDEQLCLYDSSGFQRLDPMTGRLLARVGPDMPDPYHAEDDPFGAWYPALAGSNWEPVAMYKGHALVRLDPTFTKDNQTWLGEATMVGKSVRVRPLMPIGPRSNSCTVVPNWLFCDGSAVNDAVAVRMAELDRLLGV